MLLRFLLCCLSAAPLTTWGQAKQKGTFSLSAGPEASLPERRFGRTHNPGLGASVKGEYTFGAHVSATFNITTHATDGEDRNTGTMRFEEPDIFMVGAKPGIRYYLGNFYGAAEAGVGFFGGNYPSRTAFIYSIGAGDKIRLGSQSALDIGLRHERWVLPGLTAGLLMLRVGYEFGW